MLATQFRNCRPVSLSCGAGLSTQGRTARAPAAMAENSRWLPRISAAWQLGPKTVVCGSYGTYYDARMMNQAADQYGYARGTNTVLTTDFGQTWRAGVPLNGISEWDLAVNGSIPDSQRRQRFDISLRDALGRWHVSDEDSTSRFQSASPACAAMARGCAA